MSMRSVNHAGLSVLAIRGAVVGQARRENAGDAPRAYGIWWQAYTWRVSRQERCFHVAGPGLRPALPPPPDEIGRLAEEINRNQADDNR